MWAVRRTNSQSKVAEADVAGVFEDLLGILHCWCWQLVLRDADYPRYDWLVLILRPGFFMYSVYLF